MVPDKTMEAPKNIPQAIFSQIREKIPSNNSFVHEIAEILVHQDSRLQAAGFC